MGARRYGNGNVPKIERFTVLKSVFQAKVFILLKNALYSIFLQKYLTRCIRRRHIGQK